MKKLDVNICRKMREDEGLTYPEIAKIFGVSKQAVFELLDKAGVKGKTKYSQYYKEWEGLYKEGNSTHKIAKIYNCSQTAVTKYLRKKFVLENRKRKQNPASKVSKE